MFSNSFKNNNVIITGCNKGIGKLHLKAFQKSEYVCGAELSQLILNLFQI